MKRNRRPVASMSFLALLSATAIACTTTPPASGPASTALAPAATLAPTPVPPTAAAVAAPSPSAALAAVPPGRILFRREESDGGVEHYFTIKSDGTDEQPLFTAEGCGCAHWSADGTLVYTLDATGHGTWSFTTMRPDGTGHTVLDNPVAGLNLAPGASSADGRVVAFWGWDDSDPAKSGLYAAAPDLAGLRQVAAVPAGAMAVEPFGVTPDGARIIFFAETGQVGNVTHAGDLYVVEAAGGEPRKLNADGTKAAFVGATPSPGSLSPDGRRLAFAAFDGSSGKGTVYVVDVAGGEPERVTAPAAGIYSVAWSPAGDLIAFTTLGARASVSLVRPDGTEEHVVSPTTDDVGYPSWSPDGKAFVVRRGPSGAGDLWIMDLEGRFIGQVTHEPSDYGWISWAPSPG